MNYRSEKITWATICAAIKECDRQAAAEREYMMARLREVRKDLLIPLGDHEDV